MTEQAKHTPGGTTRPERVLTERVMQRIVDLTVAYFQNWPNPPRSEVRAFAESLCDKILGKREEVT